MTASCALVGSSTHEVPSEDCSCGFYSLKELDHAVALAAPFRFMPIPGRKVDQVVLGRILLSGKVIEHDFGYRAERARIAELIPVHGSERSVMVLADRLGVGMGSAVEPNSRREALLYTLRAPRRPPARPATASPDPMGSLAAGILAIVGLVAAFIIAVVGGFPPIALIALSVGQLGRSADSMAKAYRALRDRGGPGSNRPKLVPPIPPPAA